MRTKGYTVVIAGVLLAACSSTRVRDAGPSEDAGVVPSNVCGDGVRAGAEDCDDGNRLAGDGCSEACTVEPEEPRCAGDVCRGAVYEWTIPHDDAEYANPWEQVTVVAELTAPSGAAIRVDGFYYDDDTWKVRFAPAEVGGYPFTLRLSDATGVRETREGTLTVGDSDARGFLAPHPSNPFRYVYAADGGLFAGVGISTCVRDSVATAFPTLQEPKGWCIDKYDASDDAACGRTWSEWAAVYIEKTNVDLFRWSVSNCSYPLWQQLSTNGSTPDNVYDVAAGKWGDVMVAGLRRRGVRVYLDPVGFGWQNAPAGRMRCGPDFDQDCGTSVCGANHDLPCTDQNAARIDPTDLAALERYYTYIVARYGAYVDFFELINEFMLPDGAIERLANHIKRVDPYGHPVSTSWARPDLAAVDLSSPHVYQYGNLADADLQLIDAVVDGNYGIESFAKASHGKPIIIGELGEPFADGNTQPGPNFELRTRVATRIKMWTAFFHEISGIPWESSLSGAKALGGVVFFGPELRADYRALAAFTSKVDADVRPGPRQTLSSGGVPVRLYTLRGASSVYGYLVHAAPDVANPGTVRDLRIDVEFPAAGTLEWYDVQDGAVLRRVPVTEGSRSLSVPEFAYEIAFRTVAD